MYHEMHTSMSKHLQLTSLILLRQYHTTDREDHI